MLDGRNVRINAEAIMENEPRQKIADYCGQVRTDVRRGRHDLAETRRDQDAVGLNLRIQPLDAAPHQDHGEHRNAGKDCDPSPIDFFCAQYDDGSQKQRQRDRFLFRCPSQKCRKSRQA